MPELTNISSEYELISIFQKIGTSYFGEELTQERIGMFGFITESLAHMYGANVLDATIRSKEYLVSTALKRSTLLYNAYKLGIEIPNAHPANIQAYLAVKVADIENFGKLVNSNPKTYKMVLEKETVVIIGNYTFHPEYDIEITAMWSIANEKYIYSVKYLGFGDTDKSLQTSEYIYPEANVSEDIQHKFIPCYRTGSQEKILLFKVDLKQLVKTTKEYVVTDTNPIILTGIDFPYQDQFAYFNIYYKEANTLDWTFMKAVPKYDTNFYDENVIYYEVLDDDHKVRFDFTGFEPQYNSTFRVDIYSTLGTEVNDLVYNGDYADIKITALSLDERHTYSGLSLACIPISTDKTGRDTMTMDELRSYIAKNASLLGAIITEHDIDSFLELEDPINDYDVRKTRSDIVNMTYDVNAKVKTNTGSVIPTRSLLTDALDEGTLYSACEYPLDGEGRYACPYDIAVTEEGLKVFASNIKKRVQMSCIDTDDNSAINFRIDHVDITRDLNKKEYKLRVSVMTDGDYSRAMSNGAVNIGNTKKVVVLKGFIYPSKNSSVVTSMFDFNFISYSDDIFVFEATLGIDPSIESNNLKINATTTYTLDNIQAGGSTINEDEEFIINGAVYNPVGEELDFNEFRFGIGCYYLEYLDNDNFLYVNDTRLLVNQVTGGGYSAKMGSIPGSSNAYPMLTGLCEYDSGTDNFDYHLCDVYSNSTDLVSLYERMDDHVHIIESTESAAEEGEEDNPIWIDVPCIETDRVAEDNDRIREAMFGAKDLLANLKARLLNNFTTDYKYFNTSGPSNYFTISFSNGSNATSIGDLELEVNVSIGLTENYSTLDTFTILEIKNCIKKLIEDSFDNSESGKLYMSNVLTEAKNQLSEYVRYIELTSINGFDSRYRVIQYNAPTNASESISEFISVPIDKISVTIE